MAGRYKRGWSAIHQRVFKMRMEGMTAKDVGTKLGIDVNKVYDIMRTKQFLTHQHVVVENAVEKARALLESKLIIAAQKIVEIMQKGRPEERLRYDAAKEILYQCGMKPVEVIETRGREYTPEEVQSSLLVVKEIQTIEEQLGVKGSEFLVAKDKAEAPSSAPVPTYVADTTVPVEETQVA